MAAQTDPSPNRIIRSRQDSLIVRTNRSACAFKFGELGGPRAGRDDNAARPPASVERADVDLKADRMRPVRPVRATVRHDFTMDQTRASRSAAKDEVRISVKRTRWSFTILPASLTALLPAAERIRPR